MSTKKSDKSLALLEDISGEPLSLGRFLWAIREGEEWTQVEFAKKLGVSRQYVCDLEHNRKGLSPSMASKFSKLLGYSEAQFIRLAIQRELDKANLPFQVAVEDAA
ncbi:MAG: transcriptional regulator [Legionellaceae bacterium]|nr:transcriptional regulator [Legionellaceae bacterium]|tara:strand:- start:1620 stop:1937 length:318 start_codon:yes stop_codon:yes gene_type:complete